MDIYVIGAKYSPQEANRHEHIKCGSTGEKNLHDYYIEHKFSNQAYVK